MIQPEGEVDGTQLKTSKFLIRVQPRVLLVPTIGQQSSGPCIASVLVPCPAPKILSSSRQWICTLHQDNILRLWNTDDGRCVISSHRTQLKTKGLGMVYINGAQPGFVAIVGDQGDICILNIYTMHTVSHLFLDFQGLSKIRYDPDLHLMKVCDQNGKVVILVDQNSHANAKYAISATANPTQQDWLEYLQTKQPSVQMRFQEASRMGGKAKYEVRRLKHFSAVLTFCFMQRNSDHNSRCVVVSQDQIQQFLGQNMLIVKEFSAEEHLIWAKFIELPSEADPRILLGQDAIKGQKKEKRNVDRLALLCVDVNFKVAIYMFNELVKPLQPTLEETEVVRVDLVHPILSDMPLFQASKLFDFQNRQKDNEWVSLLSNHKTVEFEKRAQLEKYKTALEKNLSDAKLFKFNKTQNILYTFVEEPSENVLQPEKNTTQLTWNFTELLNSIVQKTELNQAQCLPLCVTGMNHLLGGTSCDTKEVATGMNCPLNLNKLLLSNCYNKLNFQFFYTDEHVTESTCTVDNQQPVYVVGTNYGRVFILQMFYEFQQNGSGSATSRPPVAILDCHHGSSITNLYVAYQASRATRSHGCHLLVASKDGTISVVDLSQENLAKKMDDAQKAKGINAQKAVVERAQWRRLDKFLEQRGENQKQQRRHSFAADIPTVKRYFQYARVAPDARFDFACTSGKIESISVVRSIDEVTAWGLSKSPSSQTITKLHFYYAFLSATPGEVTIVQIGNERRVGLAAGLEADMFKIVGVRQKIVAVVEDTNAHMLQLLAEVGQDDMQMLAYNLRSRSLAARARPSSQAMAMLGLPQIVEKLIEDNKFFLQEMHQEELNLMDFECYDKHVQWNDQGTLKILRGNGSHQVLEYLNMAVNCPLHYYAGPGLSHSYTKNLRDLCQHKEDIVKFNVSEAARKKVFRALIDIFFVEHGERLQSDQTYDIYQKTAGVVSMQSQGKSFCNSRQQILLANGKHMQPILVAQMAQNKQKKQKEQKDPYSRMQEKQRQSDLEFCKDEEPSRQTKPGISQIKQLAGQHKVDEQINYDQLAQEQKMPMKLLGLIHPFSLNEQLDEKLEQVCNLSWPLLDFRIGIQGSDEAFSFIISKEDQDYETTRGSITKVQSLLNMSRQISDHNKKNAPKNMLQEQVNRVQDVISQTVNPADSSLYLGRFLNSENWKVSSYLTTLMSSFQLTILVSLLEADSKNEDLQYICEEWLDSLHIINYASKFKPSPACPLLCPQPLSLSMVSQLLLSQDRIISTCAQDMLMKPLLRANIKSVDQAFAYEIQDWLDLTMTTYARMKAQASKMIPSSELPPEQLNNPYSPAKEQMSFGEQVANFNRPQQRKSVRYEAASNSSQEVDDTFNFDVIKSKRESMAFDKMAFTEVQNEVQTTEKMSDEFYPQKRTMMSEKPQTLSQRNFKSRMSHYFGDMEVRGIICVSMFEFYVDNTLGSGLGKSSIEKIAKLNVILTTEIIPQFKNNNEFVQLITILTQANLWNIKTTEKTFHKKEMVTDLVIQLFKAQSFYQEQLQTEQFLTRTQAKNFFLTCPTNPRLFLKLKLTKMLFELGVEFTDLFLSLVQREATSLEKGDEYQRNILEILRQFIVEFGSKLERHVIQLVQILLKCLDPNDMTLRKNSHQEVQQILSGLVRTFPMIAFHPKSQRLAVGTHDGPIGIYDVRTSAKWRILEGHTGNVTCVCFDSKGDSLSSYSAVDLTARCWKTGNSGFFSTIINGTGQQTKLIKMKSLGGRVANPHLVVGPTTDSSRTTSVAAQQHQSNSRLVRCKMSYVENEKKVELVRENGASETFKS